MEEFPFNRSTATSSPNRGGMELEQSLKKAIINNNPKMEFGNCCNFEMELKGDTNESIIFVEDELQSKPSSKFNNSNIESGIQYFSIVHSDHGDGNGLLQATTPSTMSGGITETQQRVQNPFDSIFSDSPSTSRFSHFKPLLFDANDLNGDQMFHDNSPHISPTDVNSNGNSGKVITDAPKFEDEIRSSSDCQKYTAEASKYRDVAAKSFGVGSENFAETFSRLGLNYASGMILESMKARELFNKLLQKGPDIQNHFECKTLGLLSRNRDHSRSYGISQEEEEFRLSLYYSIFSNPTTSGLQIEEVSDPLHPTRLSTSRKTPVLTIRYNGPNRILNKNFQNDREKNEEYCHYEPVGQIIDLLKEDIVIDTELFVDTDVAMSYKCSETKENEREKNFSVGTSRKNGMKFKKNFPLVLGTLWGVVREVSLDDCNRSVLLPISTSSDSIKRDQMEKDNEGHERFMSSFCDSSSSTQFPFTSPFSSSSLLKVPRLDCLLGFQMGEEPDISFCATVKPQHLVMDCSKTTTPVFFVNHFESLWGPLHKKLLLCPKILQRGNQTPPLSPESVNDDHLFVTMLNEGSNRGVPGGFDSPNVSTPFNRESRKKLSTIRSPSDSSFGSIARNRHQCSRIDCDRKPYPNCRWHIVSAMGFPFLVLTTIPGVKLSSGDELFADRGEKWQCQRSRLEWPVLWEEFLGEKACSRSWTIIPEMLSEASRCDICHTCYRSRDSVSNSSTSQLIYCDGCMRGYHSKCLSELDFFHPSFDQSVEWFCSQCIKSAKRIAQWTSRHGGRWVFSQTLQHSSIVDVRGDESPLRKLKPCSDCMEEVDSVSQNLNVLCRLHRGHLNDGTNTSDSEKVEMATSIIKTVTASLFASERRNVALQQQLTNERSNRIDNFSHEEIARAVEFWRFTEDRFKLYKRRQEQIAPQVPIIETPYLPVIQDVLSMSMTNSESVSHLQHEDQSIPLFLSDVEDQINEVSDSGSQMKRCSRQSVSTSNCRPQTIARVLLRDEFDPGRAAACIDNPVSFAEANAKAKRLRPWPRGISWNCKRLTWSVRFWKDDGKTLVATSVPARKHGGVEEAFRKAVALRKKSYIHVLARVALECQADGRELGNLRWSRSNNHWRAEYKNEVKIWSAETEDDVRSTWRTAAQWLSSQGDVDAASIDVEVVERMAIITRHRVSQTIRNSINGIREEVGEMDDETNRSTSGTVVRGCRRRITEGSITETTVEEQSDEEGHGIFSSATRRSLQPQSSTSGTNSHLNSAVNALQPFPPGLIWARTTSRFFAVFKDPSGSSTNRKKRFKTFDPKKFGGVNNAFGAARQFLDTVEPWITKTAAAAASGGPIPRRGRGGRHHNYYNRDRDDIRTKIDEGPSGILSTHCNHVEETTIDDETGKCMASVELVDINRRGEMMSFDSFDEEDGSLLKDEANNHSIQTITTISETAASFNSATESSVTVTGSGGFYSNDLTTKVQQMEAELATLPQCSSIKWYRSKRGFNATVNGQHKWFSASTRGVTTAWDLAFQWVETQKENQQQQFGEENSTINYIETDEMIQEDITNDQTVMSSNHLQCPSLAEGDLSSSTVMKEELNDEDTSPVIVRSRRRSLATIRRITDASDMGFSSGGSNNGTSRQRRTPPRGAPSTNVPYCTHLSDGSVDHETSSSKRPRMDSTVSQNSMASSIGSGVQQNQPHHQGIVRLIEAAQKAEKGGYSSDDSCDEMNEQARRLPKMSNICWVPQKQEHKHFDHSLHRQAFSVFYTKEVNSTNKTTKAFNPLHYNGVKRSFRHALLFAAKMQTRYVNTSNSDTMSLPPL